MDTGSRLLDSLRDETGLRWTSSPLLWQPEPLPAQLQRRRRNAFESGMAAGSGTGRDDRGGMDAYEREDLTDELSALKRIARTLGRQLER